LASDGFIREVDEELQRDRMAELWKRYGPIVIGVALIIIIGTAGKVGWDTWRAHQLAQQGAAFAAAEAALTNGSPDEAADQFAALAAAQGGDVAAIAKLREAEARLAAGDGEVARTLLDEIALRSDVDAIIRDYAALSSARLQLGVADPATLQAALAPQMAADAPFRHSAQELATLVALEAGDETGAIDTLRQLLADSGTPDGLRRRAAELLAALGVRDEAVEPATAETDEAS
jgi:hypothetical protein